MIYDLPTEFLTLSNREGYNKILRAGSRLARPHVPVDHALKYIGLL